MQIGRITLTLILSLLWQLATTQSSFFVARDFQAAVAKDTRTRSGAPGPAYWQNRGVYRLEASVDPESGRLQGRGTIEYTNHSPDTLFRLNLKLFQNVHLPQAFRAGRVSEDFLTDGLFIRSLQVDGAPVTWDNEAVHNSFDPTNAWLPLPDPLAPGQTTTIGLEWDYRLQSTVGNHREGRVDATSFFVAYWYPRVSVYDDIRGWDRVQLNNQIEFYNDFNDYEITVRMPAGFLVWATGELQNAPELLTKPYLEKLNRAQQSDEIIRLVTTTDLQNGNITRPEENLFWKFKAQNVTDFAFALSDHFLWDATSVTVDSTTGRRVSIHTAYQQNSTDYPEVAQIASECVHYFSTRRPGIPYPYPTLTVYNGYGAMEFPMMVNNIDMGNLDDARALTAHEIAHTYFPFLTGTNESSFAWMDEGWATFYEYYACTELYTLANPDQAIYPGYYLRRYLANDAPETEVPIFTPSHQLIGTAYGLNAYGKPASAYLALEHLLGTATFQRCLHGYVDRWRGKHPSPYDFFFTFEDISGQDLDWFWQRWFMEYNTMDLALTGFRQEGDVAYVRVKNTGGKPLPIVLEVEYAGSERAEFTFNPRLWKEKEEVELALAGKGAVRSVRLVWEAFVDVRPENDRIEVGKMKRK